MNKLEERVRRALREDVTIVPYDAAWPELFRQEAEHLRAYLPPRLIRRIEHFGSTAVPGLAAKPIIDMLVEVTSLRAARAEIVPILEAQGYDYFWRPTIGDDVPPWYAFFIKRDRSGVRTHHIHMMTRRPVFQPHWERLLFRDYLIANSDVAAEYERLKRHLASTRSNDRLAYTVGKTDFILSIMARAKQTPNQPATGNAGWTSQSAIRHLRPGVPDPGRA
jgi:GrpB-like predicted nucleotidyltransferase (UPF0157 family)